MKMLASYDHDHGDDDDGDHDDGGGHDDNGGSDGDKYSPYQVVGAHSIPFSLLGVALILVAAVAIIGGGVALRRFTH